MTRGVLEEKTTTADGDAEPPAEGPPPDPTKAPPPPHGAYLDDITLKLHPGFGEEACAQVREVTRRLAAGGLKIRLDKCLAVAPRGQHFSPDERQRLRDLHTYVFYLLGRTPCCCSVLAQRPFCGGPATKAD